MAPLGVCSTCSALGRGENRELEREQNKKGVNGDGVLEACLPLGVAKMQGFGVGPWPEPSC